MTEGGPATYARHPFLMTIDPDDFIRAFALHDGEGRKKIVIALAIRYEHLASHPGDLAAERPWLTTICDKFEEFANALAPVPRAAFKERFGGYL